MPPTSTPDGPLHAVNAITRVRYGETDQMGVVYHANYFHYFEIGRTEYLRRTGATYAELEKRGLFLVVVEAGAMYKGSASYDDELLISTTCPSMTHTKIRFEYTLVRLPGKTPIATGHTVLACLNDQKKVIRIPDEVVLRLNEGSSRSSPSMMTDAICDRR